jgi:hypothetical protein
MSPENVLMQRCVPRPLSRWWAYNVHFYDVNRGTEVHVDEPAMDTFFRREDLMRALRALFCAVAIMACLAPGARADEYNKQTYLTFSGPVQLPGIVLPAGTYQFKLADPESGRRALQVWDKDGNKLYTTLLTIPDQRLTPTDEPVVMFSESTTGEPQPIRAWFYPNESYGQEFVYPRAQAMNIARNTHTPVLAFKEDAKDEAAYKSAKIGRMDDSGRMSDADIPGATSTTTTAENTTTHPTSPAPSANRSDASAPVGTSGTATTVPEATNTRSEANRDNIPSQQAVGTTGSVNNSTSANRTGQAASGASAAAPPSSTAQSQTSQPGNTARTLPSTAGTMTTVQLLAGLSLAAAFALRAFRNRASAVRR